MQYISDDVMLQESQNKEEEDEVPPNMPTLSAQMQAVAVLRQIFYVTYDAPPGMLHDLPVLHASLRQKNALKARQTTIDTFF